MVDFVSVMSGFNEQEKVNNQSRRDMAKAFADFKAANPYASAAEFQSFIDSYSGGRNYIAGGAPGSEILSALGAENQRAQAADILRTKVADASERSALIGDITGRAEQYLLGLKQEGNTPIDYSQAASDFYGTLGIDAEAAKSFFGDKPLTSIFNEPNRKRLQLAAIEDKLPRFLEYVKGTGGYGDKESFDDAVALFDIPNYMVEPMRLRVKQELKDANIELMDSRRERLVTRAKEGIASGDLNLRQTLEGDATNFGFDITSEGSKAYFDSIESQAKREYAEAQLALQDEKFESLMKFAERQIQLGNASTLSQTLATKAKGLGLNVDNTGYEQFSQDVIAEAQRNRNDAEEDRTRRQNTENATASNNFLTTLENNRGINDLIQRGMLDEAQARIDEMVGRYSDANVQALMKEIGDGFINARVASLQEVQEIALGKLRMKSDDLVNQSSAEYKTNNTAKAEQYFTAYAGKDQTNPNAGIHGGNAAMAATTLASEYNMSPTVLALMADAFKAMPEGSSPLALAEAARKSIAGYAQPLSAAQALYSSQESGKAGYFGQDTTVADWTAKTSMTIDQHATNILDQITKVKKLQNVDPATKVKMLEGLSARLEQGFTNIRTSIQQADKYATGEFGWVTKGTPMFSINDVYYGENGLKKNIDAMTSNINKEIKKLSSSYSQQAVQAPVVSSVDANQNASDAASAFGRFWEELGNRGDRRSELYRKLQDAGIKDTAQTMGGNLYGTFGSFTDQQLEDNKLVYEYLVSAGNETMILDSAEKYGQFLADPVGYVKARNASVGSN